jgi:hypothetical protein
MCRFASFKHNPSTGEIRVADLNSHGETEKKLNLDPKIWQDGHYLPTGEIELRLIEDDRVDPVEYKTAFLNRFPTFIVFLNWALIKISIDGKYSGYLDLSGLTSAKDLVLPKSVGGYLDLRGLTSAKDLVLPKSVGGSLYLSGLTSAKDLVLPKSVGGYLDLSDNVRKELNK